MTRAKRRVLDLADEAACADAIGWWETLTGSGGEGGKRNLALRKFALGHEGLKRFVAREPLRRVHKCVFAVLALESEPIDPRL